MENRKIQTYQVGIWRGESERQSSYKLDEGREIKRGQRKQREMWLEKRERDT